MNMNRQSFPFCVIEENGAGKIRRFATEFSQVENTPGNDHIQGETRFDAIGIGELAILNLAAAFDHAVVDLNAPALGVPSQLFDG